MSSPVNPYRQVDASAYTQRTSSPSPSTKSTPSAPAQTPASTPKAKTPAPANGLSTQEQQMIEQQFPEQPELSMRLYGRKGAQSVNPSAVGSRLDVQG